MPTLETTDGKPVAFTPAAADEVNRQFTAAMNNDTPDDQSPPRREPRPAEGAPKARRTRQPRAEKARTEDKAAAPAPVVKDDYTGDAQQFVGTVWTVAASVSVTQPYALILETNSDQLVAALAEGAKHSATIRAFVSSGESSWVISLVSVGVAMGMQSYQLLRDPELRAQAAELTRQHLKDAMGAKGILTQEPGDVPSPA
jgi:hypothetical protein